MTPLLTSSDPVLRARLARYRESFATSLVGVWGTVADTYTPMASEQWEFRADGSLLIESSSVLQGTERIEMGWRQPGPWQIQLGEPPDDEEPSWEWLRPIDYEFAIVEHIMGADVVLRSRGAEGFWIFPHPLRRLDDPLSAYDGRP